MSKTAPKTPKKLELDKKDLVRIRAMEVALPAPKVMVLNGHLDMIRHSKSLIEIRPEKGKAVEGFLSSGLTVEDAQRYLGKEVTVKGMQHVRASGKRVLEAQFLFEPTVGDRYFSTSYVSEPLELQLQRQMKKKAGGQLKNVVGKWPGDEDLETILRMLDE